MAGKTKDVGQLESEACIVSESVLKIVSESVLKKDSNFVNIKRESYFLLGNYF